MSWRHRSREWAIGSGEGTSLEVIDLRSISPMDFTTIETSVRKTRRLVVVHEAPVSSVRGAQHRHVRRQ